MPEADVLKGLSPEMRATVEGNYRANDILGSRDTQLKNEGRELKFAPRDARKARKSVRK